MDMAPDLITVPRFYSGGISVVRELLVDFTGFTHDYGVERFPKSRRYAVDTEES